MAGEAGGGSPALMPLSRPPLLAPGGLGRALLSLGQPPSQNPKHRNILGLYDLCCGSCWSPDPQPSSRGLYEVGAPRSSLATATAERRVRRYYVTSSRRPAGPLSS